MECAKLAVSHYFNDGASLTVLIEWANDNVSVLPELLDMLITIPTFIMKAAKGNLVPEDLREETNVLIVLEFLQNCNVKELTFLVLKHMKVLSLHISWDWRAKFLVIVETVHCNNYYNLAVNLLKELKNWKIYKILTILLNSSNESHISFGRNLQMNVLPTLYMFLSYPHHSVDTGCPDFQTLALTNCDNANKFVKKVDNLKLQTLSDNFFGCPIRISTFPYEPFVFPPTQVHVNDTLTILLYTQGLEIELLHLIGQVLNLSLDFAPPPEDGELWGRLRPNGTWTGIRGDLIYGRSDVAFCGTVLSTQSKNVMSPTIPYVRGGFVWVVPCPKPYPRWWSMFRIFSISSWISIVSSVFFAFSVTLVLRRASSNVDAINLSDLWCILLGLSIPKMPLETYLKIFLISWVVYSLSVNTVFQAFLTGFLVDPGFLPQLKDLEGLLNSGLEYGYLPMMDGYFDAGDNTDLKILKNRKACADPIACLFRIAVKCDFAELISRQTLDYMKYYKFQNSKGDSTLCPFADDFVQYNVVMYLARGSPFVKHFNMVIDRAKEAGLIDQWYRHIIYRSTLKGVKSSVELIDEGYSVLSVKHFQGVFFLYGLGVVFSVTLFVCEKLYRRIFALENVTLNTK
ncbi:Ionotropic receptor 197 [Blattella germanica]|nr:Ionotropic receptor 197 [Blattella germanica]